MSRLAALALLAAGACTVGEDYERPDLAVPDAYESAVAERGAAAAPAVTAQTRWWAAFGDPLLSALVERAAADNLRLAQAEARLMQAKALRRGAASGFYPDLGAEAFYRRQRASENDPQAIDELAEAGLADLEIDVYQAAVDASWELDLFGGVRRRVEAARARVEESAARRHAVRLAVITETAMAYAELRGAQRRLAVASANIALQRETLALVRSRFDSGLAPALDLARAAAQLEAETARLPPLQTAQARAIFRLGVLAGEPPAALQAMLAGAAPIPRPPVAIAGGQPVALLARRPDLRAAEAALKAATAQIGAEEADLYPRLILIGSAGLRAGEIDRFFDIASGIFSVGPTLRLPLFEGGRLRAEIAAARAGRSEAAAAFRQAVLRALEDVEGALVAYRQSRLERRRLAAAVERSRHAAVLARDLYDHGLTDFLDVLDAERALTDREDRLAAAETAVATRAVALYKALGGGWKAAAPAARPQAPQPSGPS